MKITIVFIIGILCGAYLCYKIMLHLMVMAVTQGDMTVKKPEHPSVWVDLKKAGLGKLHETKKYN